MDKIERDLGGGVDAGCAGSLIYRAMFTLATIGMTELVIVVFAASIFVVAMIIYTKMLNQAEACDLKQIETESSQGSGEAKAATEEKGH